MDIFRYKLYYFLGVGGIGMSALARFFNHHKKKIHGYDKASSVLTGQMEKEGIICHFEEDTENLKKLLSGFKKEEVMVIYTPAIPKENAEYQFFINNNYLILKRSEVLGQVTRKYKTIAVAGTHGKTTTTTLIAHLLKTAGINCTAFMGGISKNYNTNLLLGNPEDENYCIVVEADEYDRSFLTLHPAISVITSIDADHLDIYGSEKNVKEGYQLFADKLKPEGVLIVKKNVDNELRPAVNKIIYSLNLDTEYCARAIRIENEQFFYDINSPVEPINNVSLGIPGLHNVENSIAAVAVAQQFGIKGAVIKEGLRSFKGVKRRFDYRVRTGEVVYIDDYAHHPEEIKAVITSVRSLYPAKKITGIFQPHLFSRTRDFGDDFATSLSLLDECILLDIYPAREIPIEGITSKWLLEKVKIKDKKLLTMAGTLEEIRLNKKELILTMGAGNIDSLAEPIENILTSKIEKKN